MARRASPTKVTVERLKLTVTTATVFVWRNDLSRASGQCATNIHIEGQAAGHTSKLVRNTLLSVWLDNATTKVVGRALGGRTPWTVSCDLPREQFTDLLAIVLADKLRGVEMTFDELRWHKGILISVHFTTGEID